MVKIESEAERIEKFQLAEGMTYAHVCLLGERFLVGSLFMKCVVHVKTVSQVSSALIGSMEFDFNLIYSTCLSCIAIISLWASGLH